MNILLNNETKKKKDLLSANPKFKNKVPRLNTVNGVVQIDSDNPLHQKWFEEFKKQTVQLSVGQIFWFMVEYPKLGERERRPVVILEIEDGSPIIATFAALTSQGISDFDAKYDKWKVPVFKWADVDLVKGSYAKANCVAQVDASSFTSSDYIGQMHRTDLKQVTARVEDFLDSGEEPW